MTGLKKIITVTALGSLLTMGISSKVEASSIFPGSWPDLSCKKDANEDCGADPPPGRFFEGRITLRYNRDLLSISDFGWFGELSNQPQIPPPDTGEGPFIDPDVTLNFLPPNPQLETAACLSLLNEDTQQRETFTIDLNGEIIGEPCSFDLTESLILPGEEVPETLEPQPEDDIFAVSFKAISDEGLQINSTENFTFFGFSYELTPEANDLVELQAVPLGTGDFGLFPSASFNTIICTPASGSGNVPLGTCGQEDPPSDFILTAKSNEPQNAFGLIALGAFGVNLALKHRRKYQENN